MKNLDLTNPDHNKAIQEVLRQGMQGDFWMIIKQRLQQHVESVQRQLDSSELSALPADEYKTMTEKLKSEKLDRIGIMDMPEVILSELSNPDFFAREREEEVYDDAKDFEK